MKISRNFIRYWQDDLDGWLAERIVRTDEAYLIGGKRIMAVYRRGKTWWYVFEFGGRKIQESSGFRNKTAAIRAEA